MSYRCPKCKKSNGLWEEVMVEGWRSLDADLKPTGDRDVDWYGEVEAMGNIGCSECEWLGGKSSLEKLGIDGNPLPVVHPNQTQIEVPA